MLISAFISEVGLNVASSNLAWPLFLKNICHCYDTFHAGV